MHVGAVPALCTIHCTVCIMISNDIKICMRNVKKQINTDTDGNVVSSFCLYKSHANLLIEVHVAHLSEPSVVS